MNGVPEGVFVGSAGSARGTKTEGQDQPRRGTSATSHLLHCVPYGGGVLCKVHRFRVNWESFAHTFIGRLVAISAKSSSHSIVCHWLNHKSLLPWKFTFSLAWVRRVVDVHMSVGLQVDFYSLSKPLANHVVSLCALFCAHYSLDPTLTSVSCTIITSSLGNGLAVCRSLPLQSAWLLKNRTNLSFIRPHYWRERYYIIQRTALYRGFCVYHFILLYTSCACRWNTLTWDSECE